MGKGMDQDSELVLDSAHEIRESTAGIGVGKLALIGLCALVGTVAGNTIYDTVIAPRANQAFMEKTRPSSSYLKATRSPPINYERAEQATSDFYQTYSEAEVSDLLAKGDQCWSAFDASPSWGQFDYCVVYDIGLRSQISVQDIVSHAKKLGISSAMNRKDESFLIGKAEALGGELFAVRRYNEIILTTQI